MFKFFNSTQFSDVWIQCQDGTDRIPAHRIVLCEYSEVFYKMLAPKNGFASLDVVNIHADHDAVMHLLKWMYDVQPFDELVGSDELECVMKLSSLAQEYIIVNLLAQCEKELEHRFYASQDLNEKLRIFLHCERLGVNFKDFLRDTKDFEFLGLEAACSISPSTLEILLSVMDGRLGGALLTRWLPSHPSETVLAWLQKMPTKSLDLDTWMRFVSRGILAFEQFYEIMKNTASTRRLLESVRNFRIVCSPMSSPFDCFYATRTWTLGRALGEFIGVDVYPYMISPTSYELTHGFSQAKDGISNWVLEGSNEEKQWTTLSTHTDDHHIGNAPYDSYCWKVESNGKFYRQLRIRMTGPNRSSKVENRFQLCVCKMEFFGRIRKQGSDEDIIFLQSHDPAVKPKVHMVELDEDSDEDE